MSLHILRVALVPDMGQRGHRCGMVAMSRGRDILVFCSVEEALRGAPDFLHSGGATNILLLAPADESAMCPTAYYSATYPSFSAFVRVTAERLAANPDLVAKVASGEAVWIDEGEEVAWD